jgi:hypothetical protein
MNKKKFVGVFFASLFIAGLSSIIGPGKASAAGSGTQASATTQTAITDVTNATTLTQLNTAMQSFFTQYSVTYSTLAVPDTATFSTNALANTDFQEAQSFDIELIQEWSKYTPTWVSTSNLQTVYAVTNLHVLPLSMASSKRCASYGQGANHYVLYDIDCSNNDIYMREAIHHEYAHYLLQQENGGTQPAFNTSTWSGYNAGGFSYGGGGATCYIVPSPCPIGPHAVTGFATGYATTSIYEDQAETYGYLFATDAFQSLSGWIPADTVLNNKVNLMKSYIAGVDATMDSTYIQAMHTYASANYSGQTTTISNIAPPFNGPGEEYLNPDGDGSLIWNIPVGTTSSSGIGIGLFGKINVGPAQTLYLDGSIAGGVNAGVEVGLSGTLMGSGTAERYINVDDGGIIAPGHSPGCLTTNNLLVNGTYKAELNGTTPCTGYDQVVVNGGPGNPVSGGLTAVDLTGGTLSLILDSGFVPSVGNSFTIINNKSTDPVTSTFSGHAEGSSFSSQGVTYRITYIGGDGNDVVLTVTAVDASLVASSTQVPKAPNTGFALITTHPIFALITTLACALFTLSASQHMKRTD